MSRRDLGESLAVFRSLVTAYEHMQPALVAIRAEANTRDDLIAVGLVADEIDTRLQQCRKRLRALEARSFARARQAAIAQEAMP